MIIQTILENQILSHREMQYLNNNNKISRNMHSNTNTINNNNNNNNKMHACQAHTFIICAHLLYAKPKNRHNSTRLAN